MDRRSFFARAAAALAAGLSVGKAIEGEPDEFLARGPLVGLTATLDVAKYGTDWNKINVYRADGRSLGVSARAAGDLRDTADWAGQAIREWGDRFGLEPGKVVVDCSGLGIAVLELLREDGLVCAETRYRPGSLERASAWVPV